jgi:hypothetical protein
MNKFKSSEIKNSLITLWNGRSSAVEGWKFFNSGRMKSLQQWKDERFSAVEGWNVFSSGRMKGLQQWKNKRSSAVKEWKVFNSGRMKSLQQWKDKRPSTVEDSKLLGLVSLASSLGLVVVSSSSLRPNILELRCYKCNSFVQTSHSLCLPLLDNHTTLIMQNGSMWSELKWRSLVKCVYNHLLIVM